MPQPTPNEQIRFLLNIQRLLDEGQFTATYKYAMLLSLADIAVESGDDSGAALTVPVERIAEKYITYYWRQVVPYVGRQAGSGGVLQQNTDRQAAIVRYVMDARRERGDSMVELQRDRRAWHNLCTKVMSVFWEQPLWRLQRVGDEILDFLYPNQGLGDRVDSIELRPGVVFCLRRFHVLITEIVRGAWVQYIRRVNASLLGTTTDLTDFMFGSERTNLAVLRPMLVDLQAGRCFYCHGPVAGGTADLDHFIPWSRYPVDLGHNFVLAHAKCNASKGSILASEDHLGRWSERNGTHGDQITRECDRVRFTSDLAATVQIARWAYEQAFAAQSLTWAGGKRLVPLGAEWSQILRRR